MKKNIAILSAALSCLLFAQGAYASSPKLDSKAEAKSEIGIVNFTACVTESKLGKKEQEALENVKNQMTSLIKDIEQQLQDVTSKLSDPDYMDGLSPEGEQDIKIKFQSLREDYERYQSQFYQVMQQANMKLVQTVSSFVNSATDKIAKDKNLSLVVNKDACFSFRESFDITQDVIQEMDKVYQDMENSVSKSSDGASISSTK